MDELSLLQSTKEHKLKASVIRNKIAVWLLGYITIYSPLSNDELLDSLELENQNDILRSLELLQETGLIRLRYDKKYEISESGIRFSMVLGINKEDATDYSRKTISCDVFKIENADIITSSNESKLMLIRELVQHPHFHGEVEGSRYGFAESKSIGEEVLFGYFAQEYWDRSLKYDNSIERHEEWDAIYTDLMFIWPLKSNIFILQDTRFYGAPTLNMTSTKTRITMLMTALLDYCKVHRTGDIIFRPFERTLTKAEMLSVLEGPDTVSRAQVGFESVTTPIERELPVFNPRKDWNEVLREIINEYEVPNLGNVIFTAKRFGNLSKSKIAKALALAGELKNIKLGRGKNSRTVTPRVPTHVGKANVSDPITEEEVLGILGSLQDKLNTRLTDIPIRSRPVDLQIQFDI
jgi:SOS-response transcriptional repressor LexA